jgi:poly-gamma-glutamate synthesis protein (capsule biosynthesis protein)
MEQKHSIIIVGDLFPTEQNFSYFSNGDVKSLFGKEIVNLFAKSDYRICNLEGALTDHPDKCRKTGPVKVAATSAIATYKKLGIDCCMLANNHVTDGGHQGVLDTMRTLEDAGIGYIGVGKNEDDIKHSFIKEFDGLKIGFYNVCETMYNKPTKTTAGVWLYDEYIVCRDLELLKKKCDYLIVIYHGGIERFPYPSPEMKKRFYRMADNGADMILAQHTHCVGCEERYNGSYLLYGQGDFLLKNFAPGLTDSGLIIQLVVAEGRIEVKKHLVKSVENLFVRYNEQQDFSGFEERSAKLEDKEYVSQQLQKFCDGELRLYLKAFKSHSKIRLGLSKFFPKAYKKKWLYNYREHDLMFTLHTLRSEQNRETAIIGIEHLLNM